jgi:outer membrane immunogenic protein
MKALFLAVAAVFAAATPAVAAPNSNFTGPRVEVTAGVDDVTKIRDTKVTYGAGAGVDLPLGTRFTIGAEANVNNVFNGFRDYGAAARLGYALNDNLLAYGTVGYANARNLSGVRDIDGLRKLDGLRVGGGLEISSSLPVYAKVEYRYSDLQQGIGRHEGLVGLGRRF